MATKEETKKMVEVMNAYIEGRKIEVKKKVNPKEMYCELIAPNWNWERCDYRIKKKVEHKFKVGDLFLFLMAVIFLITQAIGLCPNMWARFFRLKN